MLILRVGKVSLSKNSSVSLSSASLLMADVILELPSFPSPLRLLEFGEELFEVILKALFGKELYRSSQTNQLGLFISRTQVKEFHFHPWPDLHIPFVLIDHDAGVGIGI